MGEEIYRERTEGNSTRIDFIINQIASSWNNLPKEIDLVTSFTSFKSIWLVLKKYE